MLEGNICKDTSDGLGWVAQLLGASSHTPKGCGLDSQSGHIHRLWDQSLVGVHTEGNQSMFLSHIDLSLTSSVFKINTCIIR